MFVAVIPHCGCGYRNKIVAVEVAAAVAAAVEPQTATNFQFFKIYAKDVQTLEIALEM